MWLEANRQGGSCFKTHTPYPKFCRWAKSKKKSKPELLTRAPTVTEETARLIDAGIIFLESAIKDKDDPSIRKPEHHLNIMETFLPSHVIQLIYLIHVFKMLNQIQIKKTSNLEEDRE
jgi:hypothetical protein